MRRILLLFLMLSIALIKSPKTSSQSLFYEEKYPHCVGLKGKKYVHEQNGFKLTITKTNLLIKREKCGGQYILNINPNDQARLSDVIAHNLSEIVTNLESKYRDGGVWDFIDKYMPHNLVYITRMKEYAVVPLPGRYSIVFDNPRGLEDGYYPRSNFAQFKAYIWDREEDQIAHLENIELAEVLFHGLNILRNNIDFLDELTQADSIQVLILSGNYFKNKDKIRQLLTNLTQKCRFQPVVNNDINVLYEILGEEHPIFAERMVVLAPEVEPDPCP